MNFTFADLSSSILNIVQSESIQNVKLGGKNSGSKEQLFASDDKEQLFANKLGKAIRKSQETEAPKLPGAVVDSESEKSGKLIDALTKKLGTKKGQSFLTELKKVFLTLTNGDLKNITIDKQGLAALKEMLLNFGFSAQELNDVLVDLEELIDLEKLTMDDLFEKLSDLSVEPGEKDDIQPELLLETSALPFLESIFTALEIPSETVNEILSKADRGEQGISLDVLIEQLQDIQKKSFYSGVRYQVDDSKGKNTEKILKSISIAPPPPSSTGNSESLTLRDIVITLETMRNQMGQNDQIEPKQISTETITQDKNPPVDILKDLFKGLEIQNTPKERPDIEFSVDQIKNQFKNEFVPVVKEGPVQKDLFGNAVGTKANKNKAAQIGLKDLANVLEEKISDKSQIKEILAETQSAGKDIKTRGSSLADQTLISSSESKSVENQPGQALLKSKATFKSLPNYVTQQVSKSIVRAINQGENTLRIQLKPPELGRLMMTIDNSGNNMKINIVTENAATREILVSNVNELKTVLSNSGVNLERFDVDMNSDFRQSMADARHQAGHSNKRHQNRTRQNQESISDELIPGAKNLMEAIEQGESMHFVA